MSAWEPVVNVTCTGHDITDTERLKVPGGWLYRTFTYRPGNSDIGDQCAVIVSHVNTVFVPEVPDAKPHD
jgi:hypothetical protein